jgi:hypothetical protein
MGIGGAFMQISPFAADHALPTAAPPLCIDSSPHVTEPRETIKALCWHGSKDMQAFLKSSALLDKPALRSRDE